MNIFNHIQGSKRSLNKIIKSPVFTGSGLFKLKFELKFEIRISIAFSNIYLHAGPINIEETMESIA